MNRPMLDLAALMVIIPLSSPAQGGNCTVNGVDVPGDPVVIEGTSGADTIDCSTSPTRHDIYGYGGGDTLIGSNFDLDNAKATTPLMAAPMTMRSMVTAAMTPSLAGSGLPRPQGSGVNCRQHLLQPAAAI